MRLRLVGAARAGVEERTQTDMEKELRALAEAARSAIGVESGAQDNARALARLEKKELKKAKKAKKQKKKKKKKSSEQALSEEGEKAECSAWPKVGQRHQRVASARLGTRTMSWRPGLLKTLAEH